MNLIPKADLSLERSDLSLERPDSDLCINSGYYGAADNHGELLTFSHGVISPRVLTLGEITL